LKWTQLDTIARLLLEWYYSHLECLNLCRRTSSSSRSLESLQLTTQLLSCGKSQLCINCVGSKCTVSSSHVFDHRLITYCSY